MQLSHLDDVFMALDFISSPFCIGNLTLENRLIQGPLAGVSAAPFRRLFYQFKPPAYTVTEMISAQDVLSKHRLQSRYLFRAPEEICLSYQLAGRDPIVMAEAALKLQEIGANLIDINCGCPKPKIRKKGAGSALMDCPLDLIAIVTSIRKKINIPLTAKLRIYGTSQDVSLAQALEQAGVDALIIHGRRWTDDYDIPCDWQHIGFIKKHIGIPVIANGDIHDVNSLTEAASATLADAYMISRAGCGRPWLYQELLNQHSVPISFNMCLDGFIQHVEHLHQLETEYRAVIQSRSFVRYYFRHFLSQMQLNILYTLTTVEDIIAFLTSTLKRFKDYKNDNK